MILRLEFMFVIHFDPCFSLKAGYLKGKKK